MKAKLGILGAVAAVIIYLLFSGETASFKAPLPPASGVTALDGKSVKLRPSTDITKTASRRLVDSEVKAKRDLPARLTVATRWADGSPAEFVGLRLFRVTAKGLAWRPRSATTKDEGEVCFDGLTPGKYEVIANRYERPMAHSQRIRIEAGSSSRLIFDLEAGVEIRGLVVDRLGTPLAGVSILASDASTSPAYSHELTRTDVLGRFSLRDIHDSTMIGARSQEYGASPFHLILDQSRDDRGRVELKLLMPGEPVGMVGLVTTADARPIKGAWIRVGTFNGSARTIPVFLHSDSEGRFEVQGLRAGPCKVRVVHSGFSPITTQVNCVPNSPNHLAIILRPGCTLKGKVLGPAGKPIAGATLVVMNADGPQPSRTNSDLDSSYHLVDLPEGEARIGVSSKLHGQVRQTVSLTGRRDNEANVTLDPGRVIHGLLHREDGRPLIGWRIRPEGTRGPPVKTGELGQFLFMNCEPRAHKLIVWEPESVPVITVLTDVWPDQANLPFIIPDTRMLRTKIKGFVFGESGTPLPGARAEILQALFQMAESLPPTTGSGRFTSPGLPPGTYVVSLIHPDYEEWQREVTIKGEASLELGRIDLTRKR